jgi:hypothetical protein
MTGVRLGVYDDLHELDVGRSCSEDTLMGILVSDARASQSAVLLVENTSSCIPSYRVRPKDQWAPAMISEESLACSRWQGPLRHVLSTMERLMAGPAFQFPAPS